VGPTTTRPTPMPTSWGLPQGGAGAADIGFREGWCPVGYVLLVLEVLGSLIGDFVAVLATLPPVLWVATGALLACGVVLIALDRPEEG
jgi:hypothetical protein